ncbi:MAG TPA: response regulator [Euzebyales bacterium]|nr:response regulator [Euzebyales bacterium]
MDHQSQEVPAFPAGGVPGTGAESVPSLIEKLPVAAYTCDPEGLITYYNPAALRLWGRAPRLNDPADRFCGSFRLYSADGAPIAHEGCWMALALQTGRDFSGCEIEIERPDGRRVAALAHAIPIRTAAGAVVGAVNVLVDITARRRAEDDRRRLEAQMRHTQKLESLGVLAGGIAHDFNNLLTPVLGYAAMAARDLPPDSTARRMVEEIGRAAQRASELTRQMLGYSGRGTIAIEHLTLDDLVRDMKALLETAVSKQTSFELALAPAPVEADATQLRQIAMNLITNASEALDGRPGVITVRTGVRTMSTMALRSPFLRQELPSGRYAFLEVADTGCGMTPDTTGRIFDPFFTTKFTGRGLGLAAVLGIVRGHSGTLQVDSTPGEGSRFEVLLPVATDVLDEAGPVDAGTGELRGTGTVLVVEDEDDVRSLVRDVLDEAGFTALLAHDGRAGLALFGEHGEDIRAVLLDLTMPWMNGWEVADRMQQARPDLPILMMSGYAHPEIPAPYAHVRLAGFVEKPFRPRDLVRRVLGLTAGDGPADDG